MAGRSSVFSTWPMTGGFTVGPVLSITTSCTPKVVPYLAYSLPEMLMLARTVYFSEMRFQNAFATGRSAAMPSPRMATNRPPLDNRSSADRRWFCPTSLLRWPGIRPAVAENGGFITMTVGRMSWGRVTLIISASTP